MAVPHKLRFMTLFIDGKNEIGQVVSVTLPKLTRKTESYRGGGMLGSVAVDLGLDDSSLDASFVMGGAAADLVRKYAGRIDEVRLRFAGEYYTDGDSQLIEVEMRGRISEIDMGEAKQGEDTQHTYNVKNTYYKLSSDDRELLEFDLLNFIYRQDGENIVPDRIRSALGMG